MSWDKGPVEQALWALNRRELSRRNFLLATGALGVGGVLAACQPSSSSPSVAHVDTLNVGITPLAKQTGDPHTAYVHGDSQASVGMSVAEQLVRRGLDAKHVPNLATEWTLSPDNLTWTFTLRAGVKMQDGSTFTARDIKTSLDRVIKYTTDFPIYQPLTSVLNNYKVIDDGHFSITTTQPYALMLDDVPYPIATDYYNRVGEDQFRQLPIAAGAFKYTSQQLNQSMTFTRHDDFWDKSRLPNFKTLNLMMLPEESSRVAGLISGSLDMIFNVSHNSVQQINSSGVSGVRSIRNNGPCTSVIIWLQDFNPTKGNPNSPLASVAVRQALAYALDRESIVKNLFHGDAAVAANITNSSSLGFDPNLKPIPYDPAKAKQLLKDAGHSTFSWVLSSKTADTEAPDLPLLVQALIGYWKAVGITTTYNPLETGLLGDMQDSHKLTGGIISGWDNSSWYEPLWVAENYQTSASDNSTNDPKIDDLSLRMSNTPDEAARAKIALEYSDYMYQSQTWPTIITLPALIGAGPHVKDYKFKVANSTIGPFWYLRSV
jgi:peptide/nickel transport system substrate-binding protein